MQQEAEDLAERMLDQYGQSAFDDRLRIVEWLDGAGLPCADSDADAFEAYMASLDSDETED